MPKPYTGWHCCHDRHTQCTSVTCICSCHGAGQQKRAEDAVWNQLLSTKGFGKVSKPKNDKFFIVFCPEEGGAVKTFDTKEEAESEAKDLANATEGRRPKFYILQSISFVQRPAPEVPVVSIVQ